MARPIVALLTDFGTRDHYAGTMKGVALGICPDATLVDITHDIAPHDVLDGALELAAAYRYFPRGTIFLVVVDPGVGSTRRAIAVETGDHRFVAPDNGVLTLALRDAPPKRLVELTERRYARPSVSRTFEGRDRFAPAAAWLAKGADLSALGRPIYDYVQIAVPEPETIGLSPGDSVLSDAAPGETPLRGTAPGGTALRGTVLKVDRFGNLVTNIDRRAFDRMTVAGPIQLTIGDQPVDRVVATYADVATGEMCALFGSTDHLEIAVNGGSAADHLGLSRGAIVLIVAGGTGHPANEDRRGVC